MIPVRDHIFASSRTYIYFFGFFQLSKFPNSYRRRILVLVVGSILAMLGWASYMAVTKPWELRNFIVENKLLSLGASTFLDANIVGRVIDTYSEDIDSFNIDINFKNWRRLENNRQLILNFDEYDSSSDFNIYVKAAATYGGEKVPIKIRLKGQGSSTHLGGQGTDGKISYRVKVTGGRNVGGLRRFALMSPARRGNLHSWVFRQILLQEKLISKRHILVRLNINGDNKGIYFIDEHFDRHLAEYSRRPDSVVVRFHNPWEDASIRATWKPGTTPADEETFSHTYVESYQWFRTPAYSAYLERAVDLLEGFKNGERTVPEVFDINLFARYFALSDVFGAWHGLGWQNLRFYFNPITGLLEPIPDDNYNELVTTVPEDRLTRFTDSYNTGPFLKRFLSNREFIEAYLSELERVSHPTYLDAFWSNLSSPLERRINWIRKDDPLFDFRYRGKQSGIVGILKNRGVGIDEINYTASVLRSKFFDQSSDDFLVSGYKLSELYVPNDQSVRCNPQLQKLNNLPDFVRVNPTTCTIEIRKGIHVLSANLVIPSKFSLVVSSGAQLLLEHGSFIISRSPIYFHGTIEEPVSISAVDSGGGGILVIDAGGRSELEYVKFSGLSNGNTLPYFLNGAVTFYRSDVTIDSSTFDSNVAGDDYLNIIASRYVIKDSQFRNTVSDGFDSDYSDGRIENVVLENIGLDEQSGGDGLDFSGSNALIRNVRLNEISDKALSVGESSVVKIEDVIIDNTTNAIVSKDGSVVEVENAVLTNLERGLIAIKKKSGYGPAKLSATGTTLSSVAIPYLLEEGSTMRINGVDITSNTKNGKAIIYQ